MQESYAYTFLEGKLFRVDLFGDIQCLNADFEEFEPPWHEDSSVDEAEDDDVDSDEDEEEEE